MYNALAYISSRIYNAIKHSLFFFSERNRRMLLGGTYSIEISSGGIILGEDAETGTGPGRARNVIYTHYVGIQKKYKRRKSCYMSAVLYRRSAQGDEMRIHHAMIRYQGAKIGL
ncbi:hypothetical protein ACJX0J_011937, partial [Zea mays]